MKCPPKLVHLICNLNVMKVSHENCKATYNLRTNKYKYNMKYYLRERRIFFEVFRFVFRAGNLFSVPCRRHNDPMHEHGIQSRASNEHLRRLCKVLQSRRRPLLGPPPGWKCPLALSHLCVIFGNLRWKLWSRLSDCEMVLSFIFLDGIIEYPFLSLLFSNNSIYWCV